MKNSETKYPKLALQFPNLLSKMLGDKAFDPNLMIQNEGNLPVRVAILGEWLSESGFGGFNIDLGFGGNLSKKGLKLTASAMGILPDRDTFFRITGVDRENWGDIQKAMVDFSKVVKEALDVGYSPKKVVAALFIESTAKNGDERPNTSIQTRSVLEMASGGQLNKVNQILNQWLQVN